MRILVVSNYYPPLSVGGYEIACQQAVDGLIARGHELRVLTSRWRAEEAPIQPHVLRQLAQIQYQEGGYRQKWLTERENYRLTRQQLVHWQPDLVYVWNLRLVSLAPLYALQQTSLPRMFELGDFWPDSYLKPRLSSWLKRQLKALLPSCHGGPIRLDPVISVSNWMKPEIMHKYHSRRVYVLPNAVPLPDESVKLTQWPQQPRALFIGRLDPEKGLHLALQALGRLREQGLTLPLSVAGAGDADYTAHCRELCHRYELTEQVTFWGWQPDPQKLYAEHQLLLMPTLMREPFGLVIIEAMLRGLAVFAPAAYGPAEIISCGETGWLFKSGQSQDLAQQLQRALAEPDALQALARRAQLWARESFNLERRLDQLESLLKAEAA